MSVAEYMALCLLDPDHGYYTTREPFGAEGDFTTAPEISQMFGELIAVWLRSSLEAAGWRDLCPLVEIGPGRGTLMKDMLRAFHRLDPTWASALPVCLVEASPRLRDVQRETLGEAQQIIWLDSLDTLPPSPLLIVANEFFDALPIRQYLKAGDVWRERLIGLDDRDRLCFVAGPGTVDAAILPPDAEREPDGAVFEFAPAREAAMDQLAAHFADHGGLGLFIDYGHLSPGFGDTLQAVRAHGFTDVFDQPGQADLTTHVDFAALAAIARSHGLQSWTATQGEFLLSLGLLERAGRLGAQADESARERIRSEVERLAAPSEMGELFKVLVIASPGLLPPRPSPSGN
ncbi:MAG: class I SAM-dependent methyltransferase [Methylobacterium mesophilicum]|nr:class I SAM-dependent methyltransferase [Methylobacterium mesophilicum]